MIVESVREFLNSLVFAGNLVLAFDLYQVPFAKTLRSEMLQLHLRVAYCNLFSRTVLLGIFLRTKFY